MIILLLILTFTYFTYLLYITDNEHVSIPILGQHKIRQ